MGDYIFNPDGSLFLMWDEPTIPLVGFDYPGVYKDSLFNPGEAVDPSLPTVPLAGFDRPEAYRVGLFNPGEAVVSPPSPPSIRIDIVDGGIGSPYPFYNSTESTPSFAPSAGSSRSDLPPDTPLDQVLPLSSPSWSTYSDNDSYSSSLYSASTYGIPSPPAPAQTITSDSPGVQTVFRAFDRDHPILPSNLQVGTHAGRPDAPPLEGLSGQSEDNSAGAAPTPSCSDNGSYSSPLYPTSTYGIPSPSVLVQPVTTDNPGVQTVFRAIIERDHLISPGNPQMETYASGSSDNFGPIYEAAGETMSHPGGSGPYYNTLFGQADIPRETPSRDVWPRSREEYGLGSIEWTADAPPLEGLSGQSEDNSGGAAPTPPLLSGSPMLGPNIETPDSPHDATTTGGSNFRQTVGSLAMRLHLNARRTHEAKYKCPIATCNTLISNRRNLRIHLDAHEGRKDHVCECCFGVFATQSSRNRHEKAQHGYVRTKEVKGEFQCGHCERRYSNRTSKKRHEKDKHPDQALG